MYDIKIKSPEADKLFEAILTLKSVEECYRFFEDVCTIKEVSDMSQRLELASRLKSGETVLGISQSSGASTTTVSRVNKALRYGAGGYDLVLDRVKLNSDKSVNE